VAFITRTKIQSKEVVSVQIAVPVGFIVVWKPRKRKNLAKKEKQSLFNH